MAESTPIGLLEPFRLFSKEGKTIRSLRQQSSIALRKQRSCREVYDALNHLLVNFGTAESTTARQGPETLPPTLIVAFEHLESWAIRSKVVWNEL